MPAQLPLPLLPLRGSAPLTGALACLTPVCWSTPGVGFEGSLLRHLVFSHVPCSFSGPAACAAFPAAGFLRVFRSPGVCPSASLVTWVGLQPFPSFSGLLLLRLLAGVVGVLHPVSGCSSCGVVCLGLRVRSPCCPSLTLEWVCFWPTVSQMFVGCEGGLGCPSWFVILFLCLLVLHLFWGWGGLVTDLWPLLRLLVLDSSDARLHRPDALATGRTLSFCRHGSLPWAFIRPWVSRPRPSLGSSLLLVVLTFPCPGFLLGASGRWMVQAPALSWALPWVLPSRFQCWLLA